MDGMLPRCCRTTTVSIPDSPSNGRTHPRLRSQPRLSFSHFTEPKQHRCTGYNPPRSIQCPLKLLTRGACSMQLSWSPSTAARFPLLFSNLLGSCPQYSARVVISYKSNRQARVIWVYPQIQTNTRHERLPRCDPQVQMGPLCSPLVPPTTIHHRRG